LIFAFNVLIFVLKMLIFANLYRLCPKRVVVGLILSVFRPRGFLDRRVNCRCVSQPRWVGTRRNTRGNNKGNRGSCCPAPRADALAVGGYKHSRGRERGRLSVSPSSRAAAFSYEGPGPSFYRRKEKAQMYNGECSSVLTCLAEKS
jgi:hypothetical protein